MTLRKTANQDQLPPTDVRITLRAIFVGLGMAAILAVVLAPLVREHARNAQLRFVLVLAALLALLCLLVAFHRWRRRRAELEGGVLVCHVAGGNTFLFAPRAAAILAGMLSLFCDFGVFGAAGMYLVAKGWQSGWAVLCSVLFYSYYVRGYVNDGIVQLWWGGRVRICERGVVMGERFVPWDECHSYYWDKNVKSNYRLELYWRGIAESEYFDNPFTRRRRPWRHIAPRTIEGRMTALVPSEKRRELDELLRSAVHERPTVTREIDRPAVAGSRE